MNLTSTLLPTLVIDSHHPLIVKKANELCNRLTGVESKARELFSFVRDHILYNIAPELYGIEDWKASATLVRGYGFCQQKAVLLVALARAAGVPSMLAFQTIKDHKLTQRHIELMGSDVLRYHALAALFINGHWRRVDPTLDLELCYQRQYRVVEFNPNQDAFLPETDLEGRLHFEILEDHGMYPDLPRFVIEDSLSKDFLRSRQWKMMARRIAR